MQAKRIVLIIVIIAIIVSTTACQSRISDQSLIVSTKEDAMSNEEKWENISITSSETCDRPTLNVVTDNPLLGDEHRFLRLIEADEAGNLELRDYQLSDPLVLEKGKPYDFAIYCRNATNPELDENASIIDVCLRFYVPGSLRVGEVGYIKAEIGYCHHDQAKVGSHHYKDCDEYTWCECKLPITVEEDAKVIIPQYRHGEQKGAVMTCYGKYLCSLEDIRHDKGTLVIGDVITGSYELPDIAPGFSESKFVQIRIGVE